MIRLRCYPVEKALYHATEGPLGVSYGAVGNEWRTKPPLRPIELTCDTQLDTVGDRPQ